MKLTIKQLLITVLNAIASGIIGYVTYVISKDDSAYVAGFLVFVGFTIIEMNVLSNRLIQQNNRIIAFLGSLKKNDAFSELSVIYAIRGLSNLNDEYVEVDKDDVLQFWYESMIRASQSVLAMSYATPDETWNLGWGKRAISIQNEAASRGVKIKRILVVDNMEERNKYDCSSMNEAGIEYVFILKSTLDSKPHINSRIKEIGTYDFSIIDGAWIRRAFLNRSRKILRARADRDATLVQAGNYIWHEAEHLSIDDK